MCGNNYYNNNNMIQVVFLFWCPYMVINVNVQYNGGFLPEFIMLALCDNIGEPLLQPMFPPKPFDCSGGLAAFRFFLDSYHGIEISRKFQYYLRGNFLDGNGIIYVDLNRNGIVTFLW